MTGELDFLTVAGHFSTIADDFPVVGGGFLSLGADFLTCGGDFLIVEVDFWRSEVDFPAGGGGFLERELDFLKVERVFANVEPDFTAGGMAFLNSAGCRVAGAAGFWNGGLKFSGRETKFAKGEQSHLGWPPRPRPVARWSIPVVELGTNRAVPIPDADLPCTANLHVAPESGIYSERGDLNKNC